MLDKDENELVQQVPEPLRSILRDYLHVEWWELDDLVIDVRRSEWNRDHGLFKDQLREAIVKEALQPRMVEALTKQEFEDQAALKRWLTTLWNTLYNAPL